MEIKSLYFNPLRECCYIVWDETKECVIIDPGCFDANEFSRLDRFISENGLKPVKILLTHGHFDHIFGIEDAAKRWNISICLHEKDHFQLDFSQNWAREMGFNIKSYTGPATDIADGDIITFGNSFFKAIWTPGHTEGGLCYYSEENKVLFSGDTLFQGSIGRTDHMKGNNDDMMKSLEKLKKLPADTDVFAGHGYPTTIGNELATNPFLQ